MCSALMPAECSTNAPMSRDAGLRLLANIWDKFHHIGEVPTSADIEQAAGTNICAACSKAALCPCCAATLPCSVWRDPLPSWG